ncbi:hypothetical protein ACFQ07_02010, partial [Actinomadura adrarensis]
FGRSRFAATAGVPSDLVSRRPCLTSGLNCLMSGDVHPDSGPDRKPPTDRSRRRHAGIIP